MAIDTEKKTSVPGSPAPGGYKYPLDQIVKDLWGILGTPAAPAKDAGAAPAQEPKPQPAPAADGPEKPVQTGRKKSGFPEFEKLWRVADESVDWTDALVNSRPSDGLTDPARWAFLHEHAEAVLSGSVDAYLEVLDRLQPLNDLKPYALSFEIGAESADHLEVSFEGNPDFMRESLPELRRYLSGMALRIARDLMALLPVSSVAVYGQYEGENLLIVPFTRDGLRNLRFSFVDPEALVRGMGGTFGEMDDTTEKEEPAQTRK